MTKKTVVISATVLALGALLAVGVISLTDGAGHDHSISFKSGCIRRDDIEEKIVLKNPAAPDGLRCGGIYHVKFSFAASGAARGCVRRGR